MKAKDNGHPQGLSIAAIVVSLLACAISVFQIFALKNMATDMKSDLKEYTTCADLEADYKIAQSEMKAITKEMENDNASFSNITKIAKLGFKLESFQKQSEKLGCNIDIEDFDNEEEVEGTIEEGATEEVGEAEGGKKGEGE